MKNTIWNFELKKTRVIFLLSVTWCVLSYLLVTGWLFRLTDTSHYYEMKSLGAFDWDEVYIQFLFFITPVWMYWILIPFVKFVYYWVKE